MEFNRLRTSIRNLKRDSQEKDRRIVRLERAVNQLLAYIKNQRRQARIERAQGLLSSTTIISPIETSSITSSSPPETNPPTASSSTTSSSDASLSTEQQPPALSADSPPNAPIVDPEDSGSELDTSDEDDSWATLNRISFGGDENAVVVLTVLRKKAMEDVKRWRPTKPEIVPKKAKIIKWILKPDNIHKFRTLQTPFSTSRTASVWKGLVDELFPDVINNADLIKYFGTASRSPQFFGNFVTEVVKAHMRFCTRCAPQ